MSDIIHSTDMMARLQIETTQDHVRTPSATDLDTNVGNTQIEGSNGTNTQHGRSKNGFLEILPLETREEVTVWYQDINHKYNFSETPVFGPMDLNLAKFTLTVCHADWERCICNGLGAVGRMTLCFKADCPLMNLLTLALAGELSSLLNISPYLAIRRLHLKFEDEEKHQSPVTRMGHRVNELTLWFVNNMTHLEELDIVLCWQMPFYVLQGWQICWGLVGQVVIIPTGNYCFGEWNEQEGITGMAGGSRPKITVWYAGKKKPAGEDGVFEPPEVHKLVSWARGQSTPVAATVDDWDAELDDPLNGTSILE